MAEAPGNDLEQTVQRRLTLWGAVSAVSQLIIDLPPDNYGEQITKGLELVGQISDVERCYIFRLTPDGQAMFHAHEWCAPGIPSVLGRLPPLPLKDYPWWMKGLEMGEIVVADVSTLPAEAGKEKRILESLAVRSGIAVPLRWHGTINGFFGISFVNRATVWSNDEIEVVKIIGRLLSSAFAQQEHLQSLRDHNELLDQAEHIARIGSWRWEADTDRLTLSEELFHIVGWDPARVIPTPETALATIHSDDRTRIVAAAEQAAAHSTAVDQVVRVVHEDSTVHHVRVMGQPSISADGRLRAFVGTAHDMTESLATREVLRRANRAMHAISSCNAALVRAANEPQLLQEVCRIVVEIGDHRLAWIGITDDTSAALPPVAFYGDAPPGFFEGLAQRDAMGEATPFCEALHARSRVLIKDLIDSSLSHPEFWVDLGLHSCIALPLISGEELLGVLEIYNESPGGIDEDEADILSQLAADLGYGIEALRSRRARDEAQHYLEATEESLRSVVEKEADGVLVLDRAARIVFANPAAQIMFGRTMEELLGENFAFPLVVGEMVEIEVLRPDGSRATAEMRAAESEWYKVPALVVALHDVTQQRKAQAELRIWGTVLEHSDEMISVSDRFRRIVAANKSFEKITGYSAAEVVGRDPNFLSGLDAAFLSELWNAVDLSGHWQGEVLGRRKNGEVFPLWISITAPKDESGEVENYIAIGSDISARKAAEQRIQFLAYHDVLTGLPNRMLFQERLESAKGQARREGNHVAILFIDLDRFKNVNDSLGREAGDALLKAVARRLQSTMPREDTISRQGGDEFLILLPPFASVEMAGEIAGKIIDDFKQPFYIHGIDVHITPSIGISLFPNDGEDSELLVKNAEAAMYLAKERGRNNFQYFVAEINQRVSARFLLENALRRAVEKSEFELYYQPQVTIRTGDVIGVEALLRWHRDDRLVGAAEFIDVAEESGLIMPIGEWVLREACRQSHEWVHAGLPKRRIAINLSAAQFMRRGAFDHLRAILTERSCDPSCLEMELTEGMIMQEAEHSLRSLRALKEIGVTLAIDDFGTGYSSLSYLRRFPIDRLKVDQSFIRDLPTDPADRAVTEAILALAKSLHMSVVAEGVETEQEKELLESLSCEDIQGFYYSRPLPAAEMARWWKEQLAAH